MAHTLDIFLKLLDGSTGEELFSIFTNRDDPQKVVISQGVNRIILHLEHISELQQALADYCRFSRGWTSNDTR